MSRLPRLPSGQTVKGDDYNLLAAAIDAGGAQNIQSQTTAQGITGQGLTQNFPVTSGSINPIAGSTGAPQTPTGLTLSYGIDYYHQTHDGYIVVTWTPNPVSDNIGRYDIYWHKGSDNNLHQLTVGGDVNLARINSVIPGQTYIFAIQAHDTSGRGSQFSMEQSITISKDVDPPAVPTGVTATSTGTGVVITWTEVGSEGISNDLKQYQVAISTDGGVTYPTISTVGPGNIYFYLPGTSNQGTVFFKVASVDWTGNTSAFSSAVSASVGTILGPITINPGLLTILGDPGVGAELPLSNAGLKVALGGVGGTSRVQLGVASGNTWEIDNNGGTLRIFQPGTVYANLTTSLFSLITDLTVHVGGTPATFTLADGTITKQAGSGFAMNSSLSIASPLTITTAVSQIIPGATSLSLRNNANNADNLLIADVGDMTARGGLDLSNRNNWTAPTSSGGVGDKILLYGASGGANNYGFGIQSSTLATFVPSGAVFAVRQSTGTGNNSAGANQFTVSGSGDVNLVTGRLLFGVASSKIVPGSTQISHRNNADNADNLLIPDNGQAVFRNGLALLGGSIDVGAGVLSYQEITSGTTSSGSDITVMTQNGVVVGSGRRICITTSIPFNHSTTGTSGLYITEDGTNVGQMQIVDVGGLVLTANLQVVRKPSAGSHNYTVHGFVNTGGGLWQGGTFTTTDKGFLLIEDIGT